MDGLEKLTTRTSLPTELNRQSVSQVLSALDAELHDDADGEGFFTSTEYIRKARAAAEEFLRSGYRVAKCSVLLPVGLFGLSHGSGFPDADISVLGIGNHRFFLFHSTIGLAVLRQFYRGWLYKQQHPERWSSRVKRKVAGAALSGFALGVGVHLAVDVFQPKAIVFPFIGSLVDGTLVDDNIWLLANSVWAFRIAHDVFVLSLAEELAEAKEWIREHFEASAADWDNIHRVEVEGCSS